MSALSELKRMVKLRDEALLSLDRDQILRYYKRYSSREEYAWMANVESDVFWGAVHKARSANINLPIEARLESKRWLEAKGWQSWNEGELSQ